MELLLLGVIFILLLLMSLLLLKLYTMQKAAKEMAEAFADRLAEETNTLIDLPTQDKYMKKLAAEINVQLRKLRSERHRFFQGDLELKERITNVSHDLRTPLTAICGYLDLLEQEETSEKVRGYLDVIRNRVEALKQLMEELFRYSIITSNVDDGMAYEDVILNRALEDSISAYYAVLRRSGIEPKISLPEQEIHRNLNPKALSRVLENILSNAVKYSDGDLEISLKENGEILFSNSASSLSEIQVGKLFDRFYTVETAKKSTGLGLSIAKILTEQMEGKISAEYVHGRIQITLVF